jgi:hypothetical protein
MRLACNTESLEARRSTREHGSKVLKLMKLKQKQTKIIVAHFSEHRQRAGFWVMTDLTPGDALTFFRKSAKAQPPAAAGEVTSCLQIHLARTNNTSESEGVLDPFTGSGTPLQEAEKRNSSASVLKIILPATRAN